jgi:hypothetical protein
MAKRVRARQLLREWRKTQTPVMTQDSVGSLLGKTGALVRGFEAGRNDLTLFDRVLLSRETGIPLDLWVTPHEAAFLRDAAQGLEPPPEAA